jgi:hypothetical protein
MDSVLQLTAALIITLFMFVPVYMISEKEAKISGKQNYVFFFFVFVEAQARIDTFCG